MNQEIKGEVEAVNLTIDSFKEIIQGISEMLPKIESINSSAMKEVKLVIS